MKIREITVQFDGHEELMDVVRRISKNDMVGNIQMEFTTIGSLGLYTLQITCSRAVDFNTLIQQIKGE